MESLAIKVANVSKVYKLYDRPMDRLKEALRLTKEVRYRPHYALNDVSFEIEKGETVGIIGTNGAGKSTILKIITGVLTQSAGDIVIDGRISALLELGAGFNMEYTGIENVYLNGTMIGFSKEEIDKKMDSILEFADIGKFVHQPVKTYSSGMFIRLAFAVAINIEPEILIVDEALSVGDVFFQAKCYKKFEEFREEGRTILFVSHDLGSISRYCDRVILLNHGTKLGEGSPKDMINLYKKVLVTQLDEQVDPGSLESDKMSTPDEEVKDSEIDIDQRVDQERANTNGSVEIINGKTLMVEQGTMGFALNSKDSQVKQFLNINPNYSDYGNKSAEIIDFAIYDDQGNVTGTLIKGMLFTVAIKVRVNKVIPSPIVAFVITNVRGEEISGTNTLYEGSKLTFDTAGQEVIVTFTQEMNFQGGEYLLSLGCTGYENGNLAVYHRMYDICGISVVSSKNTAGRFDMNSTVEIRVVR